LSVAPEIAVGDGAMGFWNALGEIFKINRVDDLLPWKTAS